MSGRFLAISPEIVIENGGDVVLSGENGGIRPKEDLRGARKNLPILLSEGDAIDNLRGRFREEGVCRQQVEEL